MNTEQSGLNRLGERIAASQSRRKSFSPYIGAALFFAVSVFVCWRSVAKTFGLALSSDAYTYILLVLPISLSMIILSRKTLHSVMARGTRAGIAILAIAAVIALLVFFGPDSSLNADIRLSIIIFALVLWWCGTVALWFGTRALRIAAFPLCFLFFIIPLPQPVMQLMVSWLQYSSACAAHVLFAVLGIPTLQNGNLLTIPGLTVHVAEECSSIRSSSILFLTTVELAYLLLRSTWHRIAVIVVSVPLSVAKNGLRIWSIAMLGTRVDPGYLTGRFHHQGGIIFFAIALLVIFGLLWWFRRSEDKSLINAPA